MEKLFEDVLAVAFGFVGSITLMVSYDLLIDTAFVAAITAVIGGGLAWCVKEGLNLLKARYKRSRNLNK